MAAGSPCRSCSCTARTTTRARPSAPGWPSPWGATAGASPSSSCRRGTGWRRRSRARSTRRSRGGWPRRSPRSGPSGLSRGPEEEATMLRTRICELLGIEHPIVLGGMGTGTSPALVAAVSEAGGLGVLGATAQDPAAVARDAAEIRALTGRPFGLNLLLFRERPGQYDGLLAARPRVVSTAWPTLEQELAGYVTRAHAIGALFMHMVSTVAEARAAARAGVDVIVAQGTEGGGHVGVMGTMPLVPMVVSAVAPVPVLAAGGVADGRGLAAALALGADGVLLGTRFLASDEAPIAKGFKQAILESDGHDTLVTDIPDVAHGQVWPGAYVRVRRNRFIEEWIGRENELRRHRVEVSARLREAAKAGDPDRGAVMIGQTAGLIDRVEPAADLVREISRDAEAILRERLPRLLA